MHTAAHGPPRTYKRGFVVTAQSDSNATGSTHPGSHGLKRWAAGHGRCRTVRDRLGVKWSADLKPGRRRSYRLTYAAWAGAGDRVDLGLEIADLDAVESFGSEEH